MTAVIKWLFSRVAVVYLIVLLFCFTCIDFKMLEMRVKVRHLNDSIPDFSQMIIFSKEPNAVQNPDWKPYKDYFDLILSYMPDDAISRNLLGYVDYFAGHEQEAIASFKSAASINGQALFWPNYNLAVVYYKKGMWAQAAEYALKAIEANPQLNLLLMQNSIIYRQISVSPVFKYSLSDDIRDAQSRAYILLLASLRAMGQYDKMIVIAELGIANQGLSYKDAFYYYAGLAYLETGQVSKALLLFQKSLEIEKGNPDVYYYIAGIYQKAGQLEQAKDFLQVSYALHRKNDPRFPYEAGVGLSFF